MFVGLCPGQFFSHVGTEPQLHGQYQYFRGVKCLDQGHSTTEVGFEPPISGSLSKKSKKTAKMSFFQQFCLPLSHEKDARILLMMG